MSLVTLNRLWYIVTSDTMPFSMYAFRRALAVLACRMLRISRARAGAPGQVRQHQEEPLELGDQGEVFPIGVDFLVVHAILLV